MQKKKKKKALFSVYVCFYTLAYGKGYQRKEEGWFSAINDKESISNHLFLQKHINIYFDAVEWGGVFWPWRGAISNIS